MFRVLMVTPHFPPDTSAGTHRVRLLAPYLEKYGWEPTVVSVDPRDYEGRLDPGLEDLVPKNLRVVRTRAWSAESTRRFGLGDLGLRAYRGLRQACTQLLQSERFDALFITIYPSYPAMLGPGLKRKFGVPFVLDYQDPWVGAWGRDVGGGANGKPDVKSRLTRALSAKLEPLAIRATDAVTAVSSRTFEEVRARYQGLERKPFAEIPIGGDEADFERLRESPLPNAYFDKDDGNCHVCYVGTLLPLGFETLRAVLKAAALLKQRDPDLYARLRLHFLGTSNQTASDAPARVTPIARELGVAGCVKEVAPRIDYLSALTVQTQASAILMMGSSESHYTASKLYPGVLSKRPILAVYHASSSVVAVLNRALRPPTARVVTYTDTEKAESRVEEIYEELCGLIEHPIYDPGDLDMNAVGEFSAEVLAGRLAAILGHVRLNPRDSNVPERVFNS